MLVMLTIDGVIWQCLQKMNSEGEIFGPCTMAVCASDVSHTVHWWHGNYCVHVDCFRNVMSHAQKSNFVFSAKRRSPFKSALGRRQFSRLPAAEVCASAVVMLDTQCCEVV